MRVVCKVKSASQDTSLLVICEGKRRGAEEIKLMSEWILNVTLYCLGGGVLLGLALWGHITFWGWYYRQREVRGALSWIYSDDGWRIALEHIPARQGVTPRGQVICCPGLACNGRIFHFREGLSMARNLSEAGWSVWILHPRGAGPSERAPDEPWRPYGYQDYVKDAATTVDFVRERGPDLPLLWVGHSLGGVIGLEMATRKPDCLQGVVTLGSPVHLSKHPISAIHYALFKRFCQGLNVAYLGKISTLVAPWSGWIPALHPKPLYVNFDLLKRADLRTSLAQCFDDTPRRVLDEFVAAIESTSDVWDRLCEELKGLKVPLLSIAGDRDGLAPLIVTSPINEIAPPELLEWHILNGYGHLELALSEGVERDVIPRLIQWWDQVKSAPEPRERSVEDLGEQRDPEGERGVEEDEVGPSAIA